MGKEVKQKGFLSRLAAMGCYTLAVIFALTAMVAMWVLVYYPSEYMGRVLIGAITGILMVIFLWLIFIQKWWFLR